MTFSALKMYNLLVCTCRPFPLWYRVIPRLLFTFHRLSIRVRSQVLMLAKYFKEEVVANLESHIPCLRRQHVTLVRENLANDWSSAVLATAVSMSVSSTNHKYLQRHRLSSPLLQHELGHQSVSQEWPQNRGGQNGKAVSGLSMRNMVRMVFCSCPVDI